MPEKLLEQFLATAEPLAGHAGSTLAEILKCIATGASRQARLIARRDRDDNGVRDGESSSVLDRSQSLVELSRQVYLESLARLPLTFVANPGLGLIEIDPEARLAVAFDALDGIDNIECNAPLGMLFTVLAADSQSLYEHPLGQLQLAAGMVLYGPQTRLVLSLGGTCQTFLLDPPTGHFHQTGEPLAVPPGLCEFAINTANYRFWDDNVRGFINDCVAGENGPFGANFNMRWSGSLVAEAYRILRRGGVFLYPSDSRAGHHHGRLRLLFDALPLAILVERAGGLASDGLDRILDLRLESLEQAVPLVFGSRDRVVEVIDYFSGDARQRSSFPLFDDRSLFRH